MTAAWPDDSVTEGVPSLEVRWIFRGQLEAAVAEWFGRFPARTESREDLYLCGPDMRGLSVKVRGGEAFEVKVYRGSPGILDVPGRARGHVQSWRKWSFPFGPLRQVSSDLAAWRPVGKRRRITWFSRASGQFAAGPGRAEDAGCAVELTEVRMRDEAWWSLGFEATGPADLLRSELEDAAELVFAQALPPTAVLSQDDSRSYADWLSQRPNADSETSA
jgi:hypothetical protein